MLNIILSYFAPFFKAVAEDPDDAVHWHQLGLHSLCTRQFKTSQKYLKAAITRGKDCSYAWSNLGTLDLFLTQNTICCVSYGVIWVLTFKFHD